MVSASVPLKPSTIRLPRKLPVMVSLPLPLNTLLMTTLASNSMVFVPLAFFTSGPALAVRLMVRSSETTWPSLSINTTTLPVEGVTGRRLTG